MFDNLNNNQNEKVDDIFADSDNIGDEKSSSIEKKDINKKMEPSSLNDFNDFSDEKMGSNKVLKKIFLIIIILLIIGIAAYFVYAKILLPQTAKVNQNINEDIDNNLDNNIKEENGTNNQNNSIVAPSIEDNIATSSIDNANNLEDNGSLELLKNIDTDVDGLSDYDEVYIHKTDPYNMDSDFDMINDYEEIMIFGTDPLNQDSDNDGFLDGQEINAGYNPLGAGVLNSSLFVDPDLFAERYPNLVK